MVSPYCIRRIEFVKVSPSGVSGMERYARFVTQEFDPLFVTVSPESWNVSEMTLFSGWRVVTRRVYISPMRGLQHRCVRLRRATTVKSGRVESNDRGNEVKRLSTNMKSFSKMRVATGVALGAVLALSYVDSAFAAACGPNTYYDGIPAGAAFATGSDCAGCPTGTTAAATPDGTRPTFCEGIAAGYWGTIGNVATKHAEVEKCYEVGSGQTNALYLTSAGSASASLGPDACTGTLTLAEAADEVTAASGASGIYISDTALASGKLQVKQCPLGTQSTTFLAAAYDSNGDGSLGDASSLATKTYCAQTIAGAFGTQGSTSAHASNVAECPAGTVSTAGKRHCTIVAAGYYGTAGTDGTAHAAVTICPAGKKSAQAATSCTACAAGQTNLAGSKFCEGIAPGYYGAPGSGADSSPTACTAAFERVPAAAITSPVRYAGGSTTTAADCATAPGYYVSSVSAQGAIDVEIKQAPANTYAPGGTNQLASLDVAETPTACPAGSTSPAGSDSAADCAGATPAAAADSAGAAMPIAAAVAAMAMPLLI